MPLNRPVAGAGGAETEELFSLEGLPVQRRPEWTDVVLDRNGYRATLFVLGDAILVSRPEGYVTMEAVENATALSAKIVGEVFSPDQSYVHIHDYTGLTGSSLRARKRFINVMKSRRRTRCLIFCGVSPFFRIAVQLGKRLHDFSYDLRIAPDYREAVRLAKILVSVTAEPRPEIPAPATGTLTGEETQHPLVRKYVGDVLRYLEDINWEKAGLDSKPEVSPEHPFSPVFEAIDLVKKELDDLFRDHRMVDSALRKTQSDLWGKIVDLTKQLEAANERVRDLEGSRPSSSTGGTAS
jgi:hypothetical protein